MKQENKNFKQIYALAVLLETLEPQGIHFEINPHYDGLILQIYKGQELWCDVALHSGTYGTQEGLLEGGYGPFISECDEVMGYLTAFEAFKIIFKAL